MMTSSRLTEKWINRGLWAIAFIFAGFLIGLGSLVVEDLPKVQATPVLENYVDRSQHHEIKKTIEQKRAAIEVARKNYEAQAQKLSILNSNYLKSKENFNNWTSTRKSTEDKEQNAELLVRTKALEAEQSTIQKDEEVLRALQEKLGALQEDLQQEQVSLDRTEQVASEKMSQVYRINEIKVFLYRLSFTLPLLLIGAWLFVKRRKSQYWPFVWGFVFFALFVFFVELVPYLPSYGGYVRYIVGIILTFFAGRFSIKGLQTYLEKQKASEAMPSVQLKEKLNYELAHQRLSRSICPSCERLIDLKDTSRNFCMHCGTNVFNTCTKCNTRKSAFAKFCHFCGDAG